MKRLNPSGDHQISRIALSRRQLLGGLAGLAAASSTAQAAPLFRPSQLNHVTLWVSPFTAFWASIDCCFNVESAVSSLKSRKPIQK